MGSMKPRRSFAHIQRPVGVRGLKFRSKMEANYAAYLEWLLGLGRIESWDYEPHTFWFTPDSPGARAQGLEGIRRGVTSCKLDFRVYSLMYKHVLEWHEVKGLMDNRSRVALDRMARYYPGQKVVVIDSKQMAALKRQVGGIVPHWIP